MAKKEPQTNKIRMSAADRVFHVCNTIFLIALALAACHDENAKLALEQLPNLRGCQVDIKIYKKLGVDLTSEPIQTARKKY